MKLLSFTGTENIGDAIQTLAMRYFFESKGIPFTGCLLRNHVGLAPYSKRKDVCVYGWQRNPAERLPPVALFVALHTDVNHLKQIDRRLLVGCRDSFTWNAARELGLNPILTGCATSTLKPFDGTRHGGTMIIDSTRRANTHTQIIPVGQDWQRQIELAADRLEELKRAELVITSRLHVALPCIAFGTPVEVEEPPAHLWPERFGLLRQHLRDKTTITPGDGVREELERIFRDGFDRVHENYLHVLAGASAGAA